MAGIPKKARRSSVGMDTLNRPQRVTFALFSLPGAFLYSIFFIFPVFLGFFYSLNVKVTGTNLCAGGVAGLWPC